MSLELPRLGREVWVRRMYWQLVLPAHEHLTGGPSGFTGEFRWGWNGYYWGRQPLLSQAQLESWVGLARRPGPPARDVEIETTSRAAGNVNGYLFSAYGHVEGCELRTAGRTWIVLAASAAALVAGLLLIYVPRTRHPASLLVSAVVLVAMGTLYPEPALLVAQAAVLGLVLALAAGVMALVVARRHRPPRALESPGPLRPGSPVSQSEFGVPIGEPSPTQTSPAVVVPPADAGP
jgi:hypothetical protein